jgi:ankyrin repeat protein
MDTSADSLLNALLEPHWSMNKTQNVLKQIELNNNNKSIINGTSKVKKWTPLMIAAREGLLSVVSLLIQQDIDINQVDIGGNTALMLASGEGRTDVVELLLARGADVNLSNNIGNTALIFAAWDHHGNVVDLLLKYGADKDKINNRGKTALDLAENIISTGKTIDLLSV